MFFLAGKANSALRNSLAGFERPLQGGERREGGKGKERKERKETGVSTSRNKFLAQPWSACLTDYTF